MANSIKPEQVAPEVLSSLIWAYTVEQTCQEYLGVGHYGTFILNFFKY